MANQGEGGSETGGAGVGALLGTLRETLRELDAPREVVVLDFEGREHRLPAMLPARRQMQVFRELLGLFEAGQRSVGPIELSGAGLLKLLLQLITDEATMEQLGRAFRLAWPEAAGDRDPLDLFPIEEMIAALVPLVIRFVRRSGSPLADAMS